MECHFHVGMKVVCVDAHHPKANDRASMGGITEGGVYTVRWIGPSIGSAGANLHAGCSISIKLEEIIRPFSRKLGDEPRFFASRFRPLQETKTDISVFLVMLNPAAETVREHEEA